LLAGLQSGIEEAVHAINKLYLVLITYVQSSEWGVLMVDASNCYTTACMCPSCARFSFNTVYIPWIICLDPERLL